jgi:hypothetical protein
MVNVIRPTLPRLVWFTLPLLAIGAGCSFAPLNDWVYIDNASNQSLVVSVDGKEAATIGPGEFAKLSYPPGEYRFHIRRGEEVLCDLTQKLEKSDRIGMGRKYLFNPDKNNRYQTYDAKYGVNRFEGVMQAGLLGYQKDPQLRAQFAYKQLLKEIKLVPSNAWNEVTGTDYVLTAPPESVVSHGGTTRKKVLDRIRVEDYDRLTAAAERTEPTQADVEALGALIDDILADAL